LPAVPVTPDPAAPAALVARLRAAGCVFAEDEAALLVAEAPDATALDAMTARRVAGEPLEQVVGWAEFRGLRIGVEPGVFVPRARTGLLVREAVRTLGSRRAGWTTARTGRAESSGPAGGGDPVVVDLCCGTGAVGLAIAAEHPGVALWAADLDPAAVACARRNVAALGPAAGLAAATVLLGDLDAPLPAALEGRVDVLVANAPYVPTAEIAHMPAEARDHEPRAALDGGTDGVDLHRRMAAAAPRWLAPGGHLLIETSVRQAGATAAACEGQGLAVRVVHDDDLDGTVVVATRRPA
jgi:release factor glutamine methyltransferase